MKAKKIIEAIKEHYFSLPDQGAEGESRSSSIGKLDMCTYYALLSSLSEDELEEAVKLAVAYEILDLWYIVSSYKNRKGYNTYSKNETIDTLLQRFTNRKSKRVVESRKELQTRFPYLSFSEQKKIIKTFLASPTTADIEWAALEADKRWDKSYSKELAQAYARKGSQKVAITALRHLPIDFIKENEASLAMHSRSELCIRLSSELDILKKKYDLSFFEYLYVLARSGVKADMSEKEIEVKFFKYLFEFSTKALVGIYSYSGIDNIFWIRRAIWALGELECLEVVQRFMKMKSECANIHIDKPEKSELLIIHEWIISNYFPKAERFNSPSFKEIKIAIENFKRPRTIKVDSIEDLEELDDLPPDLFQLMSDFI